jgi:hypothetical protein
MSDTGVRATAADAASPDFADMLLMTRAVGSDPARGSFAVIGTSAERGVLESERDGEGCSETSNFNGFAYLFMLQATPHQAASDAAAHPRYALRPDLVESSEGTLGATATGADELRGGTSVPGQTGALLQPVSADLNRNEVQLLPEHEYSPADLIQPRDPIREDEARGTLEELRPTSTVHTLVGILSDTQSPLNQDQPEQVRTEFHARPTPPDASPEPSAEPSAGLQVFHVRLSRPIEESSATREERRDSLLQNSSVNTTSIHNQSITTTGGSDEWASFTDALSATQWVEPEVQQMTPLRQVSVAFESADGPIHLRVQDRAGEMRAWVSTSTEQIAHALQKGLGELTQSLNAAGFDAEVSWPRTTGAALAQDVQSDTSQGDGNSQQTAHRDSRDRGAHERESGRDRRSSEGDDFSSFLR